MTMHSKNWMLTCEQCGKQKPLDEYRIVTKQREPGYQQGERVRVCRYCERPPVKADDIVTRAWA